MLAHAIEHLSLCARDGQRVNIIKFDCVVYESRDGVTRYEGRALMNICFVGMTCLVECSFAVTELEDKR